MEGHGRDSTSGRGEDSLSGASAAAGDPNEAAATAAAAAGTPEAGQQGSRDVEMWDEHEEDWKKAARRADERYNALKHNWSLFGQIFSKTKNRLTLERARKIAYVRANSSMSSSNAELEEGIMLSVADIEAEDEEGGQ